MPTEFTRDPDRPPIVLPICENKDHQQRFIREAIVDALRRRFSGSRIGVDLDPVRNTLHITNGPYDMEEHNPIFNAKEEYDAVVEAIRGVIGAVPPPEPFEDIPKVTKISDDDADQYLRQTSQMPFFRGLSRALGDLRKKAKDHLLNVYFQDVQKNASAQFQKINAWLRQSMIRRKLSRFGERAQEPPSRDPLDRFHDAHSIFLPCGTTGEVRIIIRQQGSFRRCIIASSSEHTLTMNTLHSADGDTGAVRHPQTAPGEAPQDAWNMRIACEDRGNAKFRDPGWTVTPLPGFTLSVDDASRGLNYVSVVWEKPAVRTA